MLRTWVIWEYNLPSRGSRPSKKGGIVKQFGDMHARICADPRILPLLGMKISIISPCLDFLLNVGVQRSAMMLKISSSLLGVSMFRAEKYLLQVILTVTYCNIFF